MIPQTEIQIAESAAACAAWRPSISELFVKAFGRPFPDDLWDLYYRDNPFGEAIAVLAVAGDRVVGHYAMIPQVLGRGDGKTVRYLQSLSLMTDPDYRNAFFHLFNAAHQAAMRSDGEFILTFPNARSSPSMRRLFGYEPIIETPLLTWTPRQSDTVMEPWIEAAMTGAGCEEFSYPACTQYWNWRTAVNHAKTVKLNDRTGLVYKISDDLITVLDLESADKSAARVDLLGLARHHCAVRFRITGYHAERIETLSDEIASHDNYIVRFFGRKLKSEVPAVRFSLLLSDVF